MAGRMMIIEYVHNCQYWYILFNYLRHGEGYVFIVVRCPFVCLFVTNITENGWSDYREIFRVRGTWYKEQLGTFSGYSI